jgi:1-acyl-sn-glycerol-3-phosphate acyltransferase
MTVPATETPAGRTQEPTAHSWMPVSQCGDSCRNPDEAQAGRFTAAARVFGVLALLFGFPAVYLATPRSRRDAVSRGFARCVLRCLGMRLRIVDDRAVDDRDAGDTYPGYARPGEGVLVVCGHVGWIDVVALAAVQPVGFVARADLISWPLLGGLARLMRVIPIERERLRQLPGVVDTMGARLAAGERVAVFPEGTTWCGRAYGAVRPALFQAAVDTGVAVRPVRLRYLDERGLLTTRPGFVGSDTMVDSLRRLLRARRITAEVVLMPLERPGADRHELAARCERAMRGDVRFEFADHVPERLPRRTVANRAIRVAG